MDFSKINSSKNVGIYTLNWNTNSNVSQNFNIILTSIFALILSTITILTYVSFYNENPQEFIITNIITYIFSSILYLTLYNYHGSLIFENNKIIIGPSIRNFFLGKIILIEEIEKIELRSQIGTNRYGLSGFIFIFIVVHLKDKNQYKIFNYSTKPNEEEKNAIYSLYLALNDYGSYSKIEDQSLLLDENYFTPFIEIGKEINKINNCTIENNLQKPYLVLYGGKTISVAHDNKVVSKNKMILWCLFFGMFGIHRYKMGYRYWYLMLLTVGGFYIWWLYDLTMLVIGKMKMANGNELS